MVSKPAACGLAGKTAPRPIALSRKRKTWKIFVLLGIFHLSAQVQAQLPPLNLVHSLPPQSPPWLAGYQVRWPVRISGDPVKQTAKSVLVSLPSGGWLKPDARDLAVQSADGKLPHFQVVAHDPAGETIVQFQRNGNDPWYWIYGANAKAPPRPPSICCRC